MSINKKVPEEKEKENRRKHIIILGALDILEADIKQFYNLIEKISNRVEDRKEDKVDDDCTTLLEFLDHTPGRIVALSKQILDIQETLDQLLF